MKKIEFQNIKPEVETIQGVDNPTEVRYGWNPFKTIYLYNGDGTVNYYIQPKNSPYHREIPKNQLIAFETFNISMRVPDNSVDVPGVNAYYYETRVKTAHEAATELVKGYSGRGWTVLNSLQGIDQETAFRIFQVVQPLDYKLGELVSELSFAEERIEADSPIDLSHKVGEEYKVAPLRNESERAIARTLAAEMLDGAVRAETFALTILDETETTLVATASGKKEGKKSPDPLDRYLEEEMDKKLPNMYQNAGNGGLEQKVDFLIEREQTKMVAEENERLKKELEELKQNRENPEPKVEEIKEILNAYSVGDPVMVGERVGTVEAKPFGRYKVKFNDDGSTGTFDRSELQ